MRQGREIGVVTKEIGLVVEQRLDDLVGEAVLAGIGEQAHELVDVVNAALAEHPGQC